MQGYRTSCLLFIQPVLQTVSSEKETTLSADWQSNFAVVGDGNRTENPHERSKFERLNFERDGVQSPSLTVR